MFTNTRDKRVGVFIHSNFRPFAPPLSPLIFKLKNVEGGVLFSFSGLCEGHFFHGAVALLVCEPLPIFGIPLRDYLSEIKQLIYTNWIKCFKPRSRVSSFFNSSFSPLSNPFGGALILRGQLSNPTGQSLTFN